MHMSSLGAIDAMLHPPLLRPMDLQIAPETKSSSTPSDQSHFMLDLRAPWFHPYNPRMGNPEFHRPAFQQEILRGTTKDS